MGRTPFGHKPKEIGVFAQQLAGGDGLTIFSSLTDPGLVVRLRQKETFSARQMMAGFAVAEPRLPLEGEAQTLAERFRKSADSGELEIAEHEAWALAEAVSSLDVTLIVTDCSGAVGEVGLDPTFGEWIVMTTAVEWE
jgi:hypothetical protein